MTLSFCAGDWLTSTPMAGSYVISRRDPERAGSLRWMAIDPF
jgi:hypothetical protein